MINYKNIKLHKAKILGLIINNNSAAAISAKKSFVSIMRGFTLIELLIVIGILAILATVVVLVLNPAEILAQARDSQRISDLGSVKRALALYLGSATSPVMSASTTCTIGGCSNPFNGGTMVVPTSTLVSVTGTGWIGGQDSGTYMNLTKTAGGSPMSKLPLDPINSGSYYYAFKGVSSTKVFEINGRLESQKYKDLMKKDGGSNNICVTYIENAVSGANGCYYELGTAQGLSL